MDLLHLTEQSARVSCAGPPQLQITHGVGVTITSHQLYSNKSNIYNALTTAPHFTAQPGHTTQQIQRCQVSLEPDPNPGLLLAASLAHLLGIMVQNSAPVILLLGQFSAIRII